MSQRGKSSRVRFVCAVLFGVMCITPTVRHLANSPDTVDVSLGQRAIVPIGLPVQPRVLGEQAGAVEAAPLPRVRTGAAAWQQDLAVMSHRVGDYTVKTNLFGLVPWKPVHVHVVRPASVLVGGQCIGVRLRSRGAIVIGFQRLGAAGHSPAAARLEIGDVIESIDGHAVQTVEDLRWWLNHAQAEVLLAVRHGQRSRTVRIHPETDSAGVKHLGVYVRDVTAGIGTLTFYDPAAHRFGALGHVITDVDTGQVIEGTGSLYDAEVTGLIRGRDGQPGEKKGRFDAGTTEIGRIAENTDYGVFGTMRAAPGHAYFKKPLPVALPSEVHDGPAKMLTVLHGRKIEAFDVWIENKADQEAPSTKSMIIHITDDQLLRTTGGIVQGMSGSPIVQDGKLVGAVTHVFMSDVTRGYAVYAAWMLQECKHWHARANDTAAIAGSAFGHRPPMMAV
ncbi:MAG: SpoIVB peptidase [Alicyclobacillus sp.]|nr:SpoIVB peptidase [Alicyclobacillus sp.]